MKRYIGIAVLAAAVFFTGPAESIAAEGVAYINSDQIRREYVGARDLDSQLEASVADWRTQARALDQEISGLITELQNQRLLLSEEAAAEKESVIQDKQAAFEEFLNEVWGAGGLAAQKEAELWQPVFDRINEILEEIGAEGEYQMIFDSVRMGIVYAAPSTDLTQQVIDRLNGTEQ